MHETDTTLADFAADWRAPTPTGAAERAVPVRAELLLAVEDFGLRLGRGGQALLTRRAEALQGLARGLGQPGQLLDLAYQRSDTLAQRLDRGLERQVQIKGQAIERLALKLLHPREALRVAEDRLTQGFERLSLASRALLRSAAGDWRSLQAPRRLVQAVQRQLDRDGQALNQLAALMASYQAVDKRALERGYARVERSDGSLVTQAAALVPGEALRLIFSDGAAAVQALAAQSQPKPATGQPQASARASRTHIDPPSGAVTTPQTHTNKQTPAHNQAPENNQAPANNQADPITQTGADAQGRSSRARTPKSKEAQKPKDKDDKQGWLL